METNCFPTGNWCSWNCLALGLWIRSRSLLINAWAILTNPIEMRGYSNSGNRLMLPFGRSCSEVDVCHSITVTKLSSSGLPPKNSKVAQLLELFALIMYPINKDVHSMWEERPIFAILKIQVCFKASGHHFLGQHGSRKWCQPLPMLLVAGREFSSASEPSYCAHPKEVALRSGPA